MSSTINKKKTVKFLFTADIQKLSIKKNIKFLTKIAWKRHTNKSQTQLVQHQHGYSIFNQKLQLQINLLYDEQKQLYEQKNTQIVAVIQYQGKVKSGGYVKYNIAQIANNINMKNKLQSIPLSQCPDPNAFVQIIFDYTMYGQNLDNSMMSTLNVSSRDLNMSRIDFNDDKISLEINRIGSTVNKLNQLALKVKNKQNQSISNIPKLKTSIQMLQGQKKQLKKQLQNNQKQTKKKQQQWRIQKMNLLKQVSQLQKQINKKQKNIKSKQFIELEQQKNNKNNKNKQKDYKKMYQQAISQIQQLKSMNLRQSINFKTNFDDVQKFATFNNSDQQQQKQISKNKLKQTVNNKNSSQLIKVKKLNEQLQQTVADMSYKIAALFNASFQFGGAKLLDYLQTSIGLTQKIS